MAEKRHRLADRRRVLGLTQEALAEQLGVDVSTVRRWESGYVERGPHPAIRRQLAQHLQVSAEELEQLLKDPSGAGTGQATGSGVLSWTVADDEDDMKRRALLQIFGGAALTAPFAGHAEYLRRGLDAGLGIPTKAADIEQWEQAAFNYAHEVGYLPPMQVLPRLLADLAEVQVRLLRVPDALRPRMVHVCGQFGALTAIALFNSDDPGSSRRYWRTAVRAADESGDPVLRANVRGRRAIYALYEPPTALPALTLGEEAIGVAGGTPCAGVAGGHAARAQALALLGRHDEAQRALGDLDKAFARLPASTLADRGSQWGWSEHRLLHVQSWVHSHAGRLREATTAQDAALALYPTSSYQGPTQVQLHRAMCIVAAGDPSEGARHAVNVLQALPRHFRDDALVRRTAQLTLEAVPERAQSLPAVVEARELIALPPGQS